jgi:hypothetical protein
MKLKSSSCFRSSVRVYVSSAPDDSYFADKLRERLASSSDPKFEVFDPNNLLPGDREGEMEREWVSTSQILLLVVTAAYVRSHSIANADLLRQRENDAVIVPVVVGDVDWRSSWFGEFRPINVDTGAFDLEGYSVVRALSEMVERRTVVESRRGSVDVANDNGWREFRRAWAIAAAVTVLLTIVMLMLFSTTHSLGRMSRGDVPATSLELLANATAVGIAAMSMLQIVRKLFRIRGAFHRQILGEWLGDAAVLELYGRVGLEDMSEMLDLPGEMLTGQLGAIAEHSLEELPPKQSPSALITSMAKGKVASFQTPGEDKSGVESDRRARLALSIQRNLDQFQIRAAAEWRRYLLLSCMAISMMLFVGLALVGVRIPPAHYAEAAPTFAEGLATTFVLFCEAALVGCFAGFLGSIARDGVAIVEKLRR